MDPAYAVRHQRPGLRNRLRDECGGSTSTWPRDRRGEVHTPEAPQPGRVRGRAHRDTCSDASSRPVSGTGFLLMGSASRHAPAATRVSVATVSWVYLSLPFKPR